MATGHILTALVTQLNSKTDKFIHLEVDKDKFDEVRQLEKDHKGRGRFVLQDWIAKIEDLDLFDTSCTEWQAFKFAALMD